MSKTDNNGTFQIVKDLIIDVFIGTVLFFFLFILTIAATKGFEYLVFTFKLESYKIFYYVYLFIKNVLTIGEAILFLAFFISQSMKFLKELKFLCKDFQHA